VEERAERLYVPIFAHVLGGLIIGAAASCIEPGLAMTAMGTSGSLERLRPPR
jgi:hypothetical protein